MNEFIGKVGKYSWFKDIKLIDIKTVIKEEYSYIFYTFVDSYGNTIIAKEKHIWSISYIEYTCNITNMVVRNQINDFFDKLVKVEIKDGIIYNIYDKSKMTTEELFQLNSTHFSGTKRVNYYNPKTYEVYCFVGENHEKELSIGDIVTITSIVKDHTTFKNNNQTIINITKIKELK